MIRTALIFLFAGIVFQGNSQVKTGVGVTVGLDHIGQFAEVDAEFRFNRHTWLAGIRQYGADYVFETNLPGIALGYQYLFSAGNWYFGPGLQTAFFYESKSTSRLFLANGMFRQTLGYSFESGFAVNTNLGLGAVFNRATPSWSSSPTVLSYLNYEFSLGIAYRWNHAAE